MANEPQHLYKSGEKRDPPIISTWCGKSGTLDEMRKAVALGVGPRACEACLKVKRYEEALKRIAEEFMCAAGQIARRALERTEKACEPGIADLDWKDSRK